MTNPMTKPLDVIYVHVATMTTRGFVYVINDITSPGWEKPEKVAISEHYNLCNGGCSLSFVLEENQKDQGR